MPVKHRIRHQSSRSRSSSQGGLIVGKKPHRMHNAHKVNAKWPYIRAAFLWFTCIAVMLLALTTLGYGIIEKQMKIIYLGIALIGLWLVFKTLCYFACKSVTCPLCRSSHLVTGKSSKHKKAYKVFPFSYASTAIITGFFLSCIRCMHCGVTFDLNKKNR